MCANLGKHHVENTERTPGDRQVNGEAGSFGDLHGRSAQAVRADCLRGRSVWTACADGPRGRFALTNFDLFRDEHGTAQHGAPVLSSCCDGPSGKFPYQSTHRAHSSLEVPPRAYRHKGIWQGFFSEGVLSLHITRSCCS